MNKVWLVMLVLIMACAGQKESKTDDYEGPGLAPLDEVETPIADEPPIESLPRERRSEMEESVKTRDIEETAEEGDLLYDLDASGYGEALGLEGEIPPEPTPSAKVESTTRTTTPSASGLKAGYSDDNKEFGAFLEFLKTHGAQADHISIPVENRFQLSLVDSKGRSVPDAQIKVQQQGKTIEKGVTLPNGLFQFFPVEDKDIVVMVETPQGDWEKALPWQGSRKIQWEIPMDFETPQKPKMDILFVMDTTGSMGEEISRLKSTIELIYLNMSNLPKGPNVRFGMVLYKDIGEEEYRTRVIPFTSNLQKFQSSLDGVYASGGGDGPEDLQEALKDSLTKMDWQKEGVKLAYVITDAQAHLDYGQKFDYAAAVKRAKEKGIIFHTIGTGGLDVNGETQMRQIAQYTGGKYIFLTYGERGESEGGAPGSVSHHTGANYETDKLESIVIRFTKEAYGHYIGEPLEEGEEYFLAKPGTQEPDEVLDELFFKALGQLKSYSTRQWNEETPVVILPLSGDEEKQVQKEYLSERLYLAAAEIEGFQLLDRENQNIILKEWEFQVSPISETSGPIEGLKGARILVVGKIFPFDEYVEVFLRALWVDSGEVLSVTKARVELGLLP